MNKYTFCLSASEDEEKQTNSNVETWSKLIRWLTTTKNYIGFLINLKSKRQLVDHWRSDDFDYRNWNFVRILQIFLGAFVMTLLMSLTRSVKRLQGWPKLIFYFSFPSLSPVHCSTFAVSLSLFFFLFFSFFLSLFLSHTHTHKHTKELI